MTTILKKFCFICGETTNNISIPVCNACMQKDNDNFLAAQKYHVNNPKAISTTIAKETGIPLKVIKWYFKNGMLGNRQHRNQKKMLDKEHAGISLTDTLYGNYIWVEVGGKIDSLEAFSLQRHIDDIIEDEWSDIILDMSSVAFFSSTGIRIVLSAYKKLHELDGSLHIANPSISVKNVLGMVALDALLLKPNLDSENKT